MSEPYDIISSYNDLCCIEMDFISLTCLITISLFALAFSMRIIGADRPCIRLFPSSFPYPYLCLLLYSMLILHHLYSIYLLILYILS